MARMGQVHFPQSDVRLAGETSRETLYTGKRGEFFMPGRTPVITPGSGGSFAGSATGGIARNPPSFLEHLGVSAITALYAGQIGSTDKVVAVATAGEMSAQFVVSNHP